MLNAKDQILLSKVKKMDENTKMGSKEYHSNKKNIQEFLEDLYLSNDFLVELIKWHPYYIDFLNEKQQTEQIQLLALKVSNDVEILEYFLNPTEKVKEHAVEIDPLSVFCIDKIDLSNNMVMKAIKKDPNIYFELYERNYTVPKEVINFYYNLTLEPKK